MSAEFANRREVPEEWPNLLDSAQRLIDTSPADAVRPDLLPGNIAVMHALLENLENEGLERSRYYGFSIATCNFARRLSVQKTYNKIVSYGSSELFHLYITTDQQQTGINFQSLPLSRIGGYSMSNNPWLEISRQSAGDLPQAERLLVESLGAAAAARSRKNSYNLAKTKQAQAGDFGFIAEGLAENIDGGPTAVLKRALRARVTNYSYHSTLRDAINPADLLTFSRRLNRPGRTLACVRMDEIHQLLSTGHYPIHDAETIDAQGNWSFDPDYLNTTPPVEDTEDSKMPVHTERLECPAVQVLGIIALVLRCDVDIVLAADQMVAEYHKQTDGQPPAGELDIYFN